MRRPTSCSTAPSTRLAASSTPIRRLPAAWAQARRELPCLGTTHADHFRGAVPVTATLGEAETDDEYEASTGEAIAAAAADDVPAVLVHGHGPFAWGEDVAEAVENAIALEAVAALALRTLAIEPGLAPLDEHLRERQYTRKHGATMYYGSAANSVIADSPASRPTGTGA